MNNDQNKELKSIEDKINSTQIKCNELKKLRKDNEKKKDEQCKIFLKLEREYKKLTDEQIEIERQINNLKVELRNKIIEHSGYAPVLEAEI